MEAPFGEILFGSAALPRMPAGRSGTVGILLDDLVDVCKACRIVWLAMAVVDAQLRTWKAQNSFDFGNKMPGD